MQQKMNATYCGVLCAVALSCAGCDMLAMVAGAAGHWDGTSPLMCGGDQSFTVENQTINLPGQTAISAGGNCQVTLVNCTLTAGTAIDAGGDAVITIRGGNVTGTEHVINIGGSAQVNVEGGATVNGPIETGGSAVISGLGPDDPRMAGVRTEPEDPAVQAARERICHDLTSCYGQHNAFGQISGRVIAELGADGSIQNARYEGGEAPGAVQACLTERARSRNVNGWSGGPARVTCEYAGTYMQGVQQIMSNTSLERTPAQ